MPSVNWQSNYCTGLSLKNRPRFLAAQTATYHWQPTRLIPERGNDLASVCIMTFYLCTLGISGYHLSLRTTYLSIPFISTQKLYVLMWYCSLHNRKSGGCPQDCNWMPGRSRAVECAVIRNYLHRSTNQVYKEQIDSN